MIWRESGFLQRIKHEPSIKGSAKEDLQRAVKV
jgi:hypothetical protein